jgi:hypothetical protein
MPSSAHHAAEASVYGVLLPSVPRAVTPSV